MRNFYNVPCPCSKVLYDSGKTIFVEMRSDVIIDFKEFLEEALSMDGDYFIYKMVSETFYQGDENEVCLRFSYAYISQEEKEKLHLGSVVKINEDTLPHRNLPRQNRWSSIRDPIIPKKGMFDGEVFW